MKALIIIITIILIDFITAKLNKKAKIVYKKKVGNNFNALTFPPLFIYIKKSEENNKVLLEHELVHWEQYRKLGFILYYLKYTYEIKFFGYDKSPMEIEARVLSGEKEECLINYTDCVRSGKALTVHDKDFRK